LTTVSCVVFVGFNIAKTGQIGKQCFVASGVYAGIKQDFALYKVFLKKATGNYFTLHIIEKKYYLRILFFF